MPEGADKTDDEKKPCEPSEDNRKSDLCAQWKAADAAADSARWARLGFYLGIFGFAAGLATLAAAIVAAKGAWDAARHTEAAVRETRGSNELAQKTFMAERRPYITPVDFTIIRKPGPADETECSFLTSFYWKNSGQDWPRKMVSYVNWMPFENDLPHGFTYPDINRVDNSNFILISPGDCAGGAKIEIDRRNIDLMISRNIKIYVWGWFEYNDRFADTPRRRTEFCLVSANLGDSVPIDEKRRSVVFNFEVYGPHNAADDECVGPLRTPHLR